MNGLWRGLAGLLLFAGVTAVAAAAAPPPAAHRLEVFLHGLERLQADFRQSVTDDHGRVLQRSRGTLYLERPDRFRWDYRKPAELLVSDGRNLWFYDRGLEQITVRPLARGLGDLPVGLLAGTRSVESRFRVTAAGAADGLHWLLLTPREKGGGFEWIRLGFRGDLLVRMELRDSLGQTTHIAFSHVRRNPPLAASLFRFTPPPGVDVAGTPAR